MIRNEWKPREAREGSVNEEHDGDDVDEHIVDDTGHTDTNLHAEHGIHPSEYTKTTEHGNADGVLDGLIDTMDSLSLVPPSIRFGRGGRKGGLNPNSERGDFGDSISNRGSGHRGRGRGGSRGRGGRGGIPRTSTEMNALERAGRGRVGSIRRAGGQDGITS